MHGRRRCGAPGGGGGAAEAPHGRAPQRAMQTPTLKPQPLGTTPAHPPPARLPPQPPSLPSPVAAPARPCSVASAAAQPPPAPAPTRRSRSCRGARPPFARRGGPAPPSWPAARRRGPPAPPARGPAAPRPAKASAAATSVGWPGGLPHGGGGRGRERVHGCMQCLVLLWAHACVCMLACTRILCMHLAASTQPASRAHL